MFYFLVNQKAKLMILSFILSSMQASIFNILLSFYEDCILASSDTFESLICKLREVQALTETFPQLIQFDPFENEIINSKFEKLKKLKSYEQNWIFQLEPIITRKKPKQKLFFERKAPGWFKKIHFVHKLYKFEILKIEGLKHFLNVVFRNPKNSGKIFNILQKNKFFDENTAPEQYENALKLRISEEIKKIDGEYMKLLNFEHFLRYWFNLKEKEIQKVRDNSFPEQFYF